MPKRQHMVQCQVMLFIVVVEMTVVIGGGQILVPFISGSRKIKMVRHLTTLGLFAGHGHVIVFATTLVA
ncbi:hypothetical protein D3C81_1810140 [compost metagenome]